MGEGPVNEQIEHAGVPYSRMVEIGDENWIDTSSVQYVAVAVHRAIPDKEHPDIYVEQHIVSFVVAGFVSNVAFDNRADVDRTLNKLGLPKSTWKDDHDQPKT